MEKTLLDQKAWMVLFMDTPLSIPGGLPKATAFETVGCKLKTREKSGGWPADYGILHAFGPTVVVISYHDRLEMHAEKSLCKWEGSVQEYKEMWECD